MRLLTRDETDMLLDALDILESKIAEREFLFELDAVWALRSLVIDAAANSQEINNFVKKMKKGDE